MKKLGFLASAAFIIFALAVSVLVPLQSKTAKAQANGRNILFLGSDDLRNWVSYADQYPGTVHTPNLDTLEEYSTNFSQARTAMTQCPGARTSVMLGLSPATHNITGNFGPNDPNYNALYSDTDITSLPEVLSENGYYTASAGKVFHRPEPTRWNQQGPLVPQDFMSGGNKPGPDWTFFNPKPWPENETHPDQTTADFAKDFITDYDEEEPFFLAAGFYMPHVPWEVPQWAFDMYPLEDIQLPVNETSDLDDEPQLATDMAEPPIYPALWQTEPLPHNYHIEQSGNQKKYVQGYLAAVTYMDSLVGEILTSLANSQHAANTDVIFWSDHGFALGEKGHWNKTTVWDPSARVPLLVASPGNPNYPVGEVTRPVSTLDLAPTVLDLAGIGQHLQFEGKPLHVDDGRKVEVYARNARAQVVNGFKVVDYDRTEANGIEDMAAYWLDYDPGETNNVICPLIRAIYNLPANYCDQ